MFLEFVGLDSAESLEVGGSFKLVSWGRWYMCVHPWLEEWHSPINAYRHGHKLYITIYSMVKVITICCVIQCIHRHDVSLSMLWWQFTFSQTLHGSLHRESLHLYKIVDRNVTDINMDNWFIVRLTFSIKISMKWLHQCKLLSQSLLTHWYCVIVNAHFGDLN